MEDILMQYLLKILGYILSAAAVWLGYELKKLAKKYVNTQTKKDVARTVVQAVEQMYKDLHGDEKLNKAMERASAMLEEQGVHVTTLELRTLIEDAVGEFNGVFWGKDEAGNKPEPVDAEK